MNLRRGSQPIAGHHIVRVLEAYRGQNPACTLQVHIATHDYDNEEVVVFDGVRPVAQIRSRGYPAPRRERLVVRVAQPWEEPLGELLRYADSRLGRQLRTAYRTTPLRAHNVSQALRDVVAGQGPTFTFPCYPVGDAREPAQIDSG